MDATTIAQLLKEKGIRPTAQRIGVYENIAQRCDHPTVDMLYQDMLVQAGLVRTVTINSNEARFDADTSLHGHFQCVCCGEVSDFRLPEARLETAGLEGYEVSTQDVYFTGRCPKCQKN